MKFSYKTEFLRTTCWIYNTQLHFRYSLLCKDIYPLPFLWTVFWDNLNLPGFMNYCLVNRIYILSIISALDTGRYQMRECGNTSYLYTSQEDNREQQKHGDTSLGSVNTLLKFVVLPWRACEKRKHMKLLQDTACFARTPSPSLAYDDYYDTFPLCLDL
jgi:hypothetical protein